MTREQPVVSNARWWRHDSCRCTLSVSTRRPASVALARLSIYRVYNRRYSLHIVLRDPTADADALGSVALCALRRAPVATAGQLSRNLHSLISFRND